MANVFAFGAVVHGARIGENALVGMNAVVMDHAVVGAGSIVGALCFVPSEMQIPERSVLEPCEPLRAVPPDRAEQAAGYRTWKETSP